jgi:hypothetical protein
MVPIAAHSVFQLPEGPEWLYELKVDSSPYSEIVITPDAI